VVVKAGDFHNPSNTKGLKHDQFSPSGQIEGSERSVSGAEWRRMKVSGFGGIRLWEHRSRLA
jgi:hypothetical protein